MNRLRETRTHGPQSPCRVLHAGAVEMAAGVPVAAYALTRYEGRWFVRAPVLTTFHLDEYVFAALEAGASGFLLKDTPPAEIAAAVRAVAAGSEMLSPAVTRRLIAEYVGGRAQPQRAEALRRLEVLSDREREVLVLIGRGLSNAAAARTLFMSEATVKTYVSRMLTKLGLANRTQAAILGHAAGLLEGGQVK